MRGLSLMYAAAWMGGELEENGYRQMQGWIPLLFIWKHHNTDAGSITTLMLIIVSIPIQNKKSKKKKNLPHQCGAFITTDQLCRYTIINQCPYFTLGFTLGVVHSMGFGPFLSKTLLCTTYERKTCLAETGVNRPVHSAFRVLRKLPT